MGIILASQSPRRQALLEQLGVRNFAVRPARGEEEIDPNLPPRLLVEKLSRQKAREVAQTAGQGDLVIAADTVVVVDETVLGKPESPAHAAEMLRLLSGREHRVLTGVTLWRDGREETSCEETRVHFRGLAAEEISAYVATGEPMDKAGAYGIQGYGSLLVAGISGDYSNVVGLPLCMLGQMLRAWGIDLLAQAGEKGGRM